MNDVANVNNLFEALLTFWDGDIPGITHQKELMEDGNIIQFGVPPNRIDLMNTIDGVNFKEAWEEKETVYLSVHKKNIPIYFLGLDDLIINKKQSGRNKDLDDLAYLKAIQEKGGPN